MKYEKFIEVKKACHSFTSVSVTGCRNQRNQAEQMLAKYIKDNAVRFVSLFSTSIQ